MSATRPSSPVHRERPPFIGREAGVSLVYPNGCPSSTYQPLNDVRDDSVKEKSCRLDIVLESDCVSLKGTGVGVEPAFLTGQVILTLTEPTSLREITLQFRGKTRLPNESIINSAAIVTYTVCNHEWSFLEGDKRHSRTLKAGRHIFPFHLKIGGSLPSSICTRDGSATISYRLRAQATRPGLSSNVNATVPVHIVRSFSSEALEYQQTLEVENTWSRKFMYSIMVPHKAWAAGDTITVVVKLSPFNKGISVISIATMLHESTSVYARCGSHTRLLACVKHAIVNGRAVLSENYIATGGPSAEGSGPSAGESSEPVPIEDEPVGGEVDGPIPENNDVVTNLMIPIPSSATPTHGIEPIIVNHRIRWVILIANPDGHTSELRCSLPIHILDARLLKEARQHTAATRRLLIGGPEVPPLEQEEIELPSYPSHVRDRIAAIGPPEVGALGASNASSSVTPTPPLTPDGGLVLQNLPGLRSGHSTPLEFSLFSHLPHMPESGDNTSLEWINSELLSRRRAPLQPTFHLADEHTDSDHSRPTSQPASRRSSRPASRSSSPDSHHPSGSSHRSDSDHPSHQHNSHQSHRNLHGFLKATMRPFTSITQSNWLRTASHGYISELPDQHGSSDTRHSRPQSSYFSPTRDVSILPECSSRESNSRLPVHQTASSSSLDQGPRLPLHCALTTVPDYDAASRGFLSGLPPLTSLQALPSYEEASMPVPQVTFSANADGVDARVNPETRRESLPSRPAFGPAQRARSEGDLVARIAGLGWSLDA